MILLRFILKLQVLSLSHNRLQETFNKAPRDTMSLPTAQHVISLDLNFGDIHGDQNAYHAPVYSGPVYEGTVHDGDVYNGNAYKGNSYRGNVYEAAYRPFSTSEAELSDASHHTRPHPSSRTRSGNMDMVESRQLLERLRWMRMRGVPLSDFEMPSEVGEDYEDEESDVGNRDERSEAEERDIHNYLTASTGRWLSTPSPPLTYCEPNRPPIAPITSPTRHFSPTPSPSTVDTNTQTPRTLGDSSTRATQTQTHHNSDDAEEWSIHDNPNSTAEEWRFTPSSSPEPDRQSIAPITLPSQHFLPTPPPSTARVNTRTPRICRGPLPYATRVQLHRNSVDTEEWDMHDNLTATPERFTHPTSLEPNLYPTSFQSSSRRFLPDPTPSTVRVNKRTPHTRGDPLHRAAGVRPHRNRDGPYAINDQPPPVVGTDSILLLVVCFFGFLATCVSGLVCILLYLSSTHYIATSLDRN